MKKLSLVLLISTILLAACGDNKEQKATDTTTAVEQTKSAETVPVIDDSGEAIHQANCVRCHDTGVYTREDRKVTSLDGLTKQVQMCDTQLETQLFPEDLDKIVSYLNKSFYKF